jgi:subtilisin family serine protease
MKQFKIFKSIYVFVAVVAMAFCNQLNAQDITAQRQGGLEVIPGQYIVKMKSTANDLAISAETANARPTDDDGPDLKVKQTRIATLGKVQKLQVRGGVQKASVIHEYSNVMVGFSAKLNDDQIKKLRADPDVEGVYPDYVIKLSPTTTEQNPTVSAQYVPCGITLAGGPVNGSAKATWIWILDTGIDLDHPDLNVQTNATYAKSFISGQTVEDGHGHGTHCAGIAAAKSNTFGVVGVSAGARVVPVKVLSNAGSGSFSGIIAGLNHVASKKIAGDVVSMSIGAYPLANCENSNPVLRDVIRNLGNAGVWVVMAAGNDSDANGTGKNLPGCINGNRVLTVGSITCQKTCSGFSNWGIGTDWAAVGSSVYSTYKNGTYATLSGTSMATPTVAGICHARNNYPVSAGNINCGGRTYKIARR